ncbi:circularly permuted type 2 ATP-grasp protein [Salinicola endophyticus]|uniref:Circularly permuted type 2 ATP-grasp protein n=1 Tax=Salinicola endophyticus TaxID=1949083 RepID=A0AB74UBG2_9GAMM
MAEIDIRTTPWLGDYETESGFDLLVTPRGSLRRRWQPLLAALERLDRDTLAQRVEEIQRLLHENGVTYGRSADDPESLRQWRLDPLPLVITPTEWQHLERALLQRMRLLDALLADIYGPRRMLEEGVLPADALFANPGFLLACDRLYGKRGPALSLLAVDLSRDSDGRWCVLADHLQTPTGMGFALENRIAMARAFPGVYRNAPLRRLAGFLERQHHALGALSPLTLDQPRIALLAPGSAHASHFEHAYLANYLNLALVEGSDLVVRDARVWMRTLGGLEPVDVLLKQIGDAWSDPLELEADSLIGVPGLLAAIRGGGVGVANPPGVGVLENPLIAASLPRLCERLLGEPLAISGPESHWCGEAAGLAWSLADFERLRFQRIDVGHAIIEPKSLAPAAQAALRAALVAHPERYVASRPLEGATAPFMTHVGAGLTPATFNLRCFVQARYDDQRRPAGFEAMPGGVAWQGLPGAEMATSQCVKDVWVSATSPQPHVSRLRRASQAFVVTRDGADLPSRVAESLFWLGRYGERLDGQARLLREAIYRLMEQDQETLADPALDDLLRLLGLERELADPARNRFQHDREQLLSLFKEGHPEALPSLLARLVANGRAVRDHLGDDAWRVFNQLHQEGARLPQAGIHEGRRAVEALITQSAAFFGFCNETMPHHYGWRFLDIGRFIERAMLTLRLLRVALIEAPQSAPQGDNAPATGDGLWEVVLATTDNASAYRRRYRSELYPAAILDLLLFDEGNPRSIGYMFKRLERQIAHLPQPQDTPYRSDEARLLIRARAALHLADLDSLAESALLPQARQTLATLLDALAEPLAALSQAIEYSHFSHAEAPRQLIPMQAP